MKRGNNRPGKHIVGFRRGLVIVVEGDFDMGWVSGHGIVG